METFELIAKTFQGLEEVLAQELTELGADEIQIGRRMVSFVGFTHLNSTVHGALESIL